MSDCLKKSTRLEVLSAGFSKSILDLEVKARSILDLEVEVLDFPYVY